MDEIDYERRKNTWRAVMKNKWTLSDFGREVLSHLFCKDRDFCKQNYDRNVFVGTFPTGESFDDFYERNCLEDRYLSGICIKCDLHGIFLEDCEELVRLYAKFRNKMGSDEYNNLISYCG